MIDPKPPVYDARLENLDASPVNPQRIGRFVKVVRIPRPRMNAGTWWQLTDGRGSFWEVRPDRLRPVPDTGQARVLSCTCDYAGMEGEPHKTWCELEGGPHAECAARVEALEAERDQLWAQLAGRSSATRQAREPGTPRLEAVLVAVRQWAEEWPAAHGPSYATARKVFDAIRTLDEAPGWSSDTVPAPTAEVSGWDGAA